MVDEAMQFVMSFNITVEEVGKWLPSLKLPAENFFYDVISFVESLRCKPFSLVKSACSLEIVL